MIKRPFVVVVATVEHNQLEDVAIEGGDMGMLGPRRRRRNGPILRGWSTGRRTASLCCGGCVLARFPRHICTTRTAVAAAANYSEAGRRLFHFPPLPVTALVALSCGPGNCLEKISSRAVLGEALQLVTYLSVTETACMYSTLYGGLPVSTSATLTRQIYINHFLRRHGHESGNISCL